MSRATYLVTSEAQRGTALDAIRRAPLGFVIEAKRNKRSTPQNDRMWAMLTAIGQQHTHHGMKYSPEDWKLIFMAGLNQELRVAPNVDGTGLVQLGRSTSRLTKAEHSDLTALIEAFAAQHGVDLHEHMENENG
jgi:hypothetical protein